MNSAKENSSPVNLKDSYLTDHSPKAGGKFKILFLCLGIILVIAGYIWFITYGYWTIWNPSTYYYDHLAAAFSHGSLALDDKVNPELLALENPYSPFDRQGIKFPLDFSLYKGKYYLYFGPVPALLLVIPKLLGIGTIGDHILVFIFICAIFMFESLIVMEIRNRFFQEIPDWVLPFCLLFIGLASPISWMLTEARVYEAAITAGQAFLLAGFYFDLTAITKNPISPWRFFIGGVFWAFAFGSRLTLILPIGLVTLLFFVFIIRNSLPWKPGSKVMLHLFSLCAPLLIGVLLLGWYNWDRFNSVFETGFSYQLTSRNLQKYADVLFSPLYILPNSYEYLLAKPKFLGVFPFMQPVRGRGWLHFPFLTLPDIYWTSALSGIFYSTPFIVFAGLPVLSMIMELFRKKVRNKAENNSGTLYWIIVGLLVAGLSGFFTVTSFFWVAARYFIDFSPSFVLLSVTGFFLGYHYLNRWPAFRTIYIMIGIGLMLVSVISSNLLVLGIRTATYLDWNPGMWNQLYNFFTP